MWADDVFWLPQMIANHTFHGRFIFQGERITWQQVLFDV
jgi:hypothetical protein